MNTPALDVNITEKRITVTVLGDSIDTNAGNDILVNELSAVRYRDAYFIQMLAGECWLFNYGVLVTWSVSEDERQQLCKQLEGIIQQPLASIAIEQYRWHTADGQDFNIHHDELTLPNDEHLTRLALSHAFAQSAKVTHFEDKALQVIKKNAFIPKKLAQTGKASLSRSELAKRRGELIETINDINLHFGLLDTPEFFWDYPALEDLYLKLSRYLDLQPRVEILGKKLSTIQNMLDMLADEQNHKHSAFLEWIIIILIAVDIAMYFIK